MQASPFSGRILTALAGAAIAVFALSFFLAARGGGENGIGNVVRPSTYSHSAIGHAGLYETLKRLGFNVARDRGGASGEAGSGDVSIMAEPDPVFLAGDHALRASLARDLLLVLPKWRGTRADDRPDWIGAIEPLPPDAALAAIRLVDGKAEVLRDKPAGPWTVDELGAAPRFSGTVQLLKSPNITPILASADGILLGKVENANRRIFVLSDPEPIENHGLALAGNPGFVVAMIEAFSDRGEDRIVFDEAVHGIAGAPESPLTLLVTFPYSVLTLQVLVAIALLLGATMARFGPPETAPPALRFGKAALIANAAALLDYAGHQDEVLRRHARITLADAGRQLHAPANLDGPGLAAWLDRIGAARGVGLRASDIIARIDALPGGARGLTGLFTAVRDLHRWKGDILDGSAAHPLRH